MAFVRITAMALMLVLVDPHPSESQNQYEPRDDSPHPPHLLREATDRNEKPPESLEVHLPHRFDLIKKFPNSLTVPELQVGCADGFIHHHDSKKLSEVEKIKSSLSKLRERRHVKKKEKRSFYPWSGQYVQHGAPYNSITYWKPPTYQLSRPYFIPIFGIPGRIPIYYPPQPLLINPGFPIDNPINGPVFHGPPYLPPRPFTSTTTTPAPTTTSPTTTAMSIRDRFNGEDDDSPIWDIVSSETTSPSSSGMSPTRRPRPSVPQTHPPLVHNSNATNTGQAEQVGDTRPQTVRPPSPAFAPPPPATAAPSPPLLPQNAVVGAPAPPRGPSNCVWAIISCCSVVSNEIRYDCFDQRGCPGAFWDHNPCDSNFARAAIASAFNYYEG